MVVRHATKNNLIAKPKPKIKYHIFFSRINYKVVEENDSLACVKTRGDFSVVVVNKFLWRTKPGSLFPSSFLCCPV